MFKKWLFSILTVSLLAFYSCDGYQKLLKSKDYTLKYDKAMEYFQQEDYFKALQLFDELIIIHRGTDKAEQIYYYYSYCYYNQKEYLMASYNFKNFAKTFPQSELAEECLYMSAYCKYMLSPSYTLDQKSTLDAIKELQLFINLYPNSPRVEQCNTHIDELRFKMEKKDYEIAKLYYKTSEYSASISAFKTLLKEYPGSDYKEKSLFYIAKANLDYASKSVISKQLERFQSTIEATDLFIKSFPESDMMKEIKQVKATAQKEIELRTI